MGDYSVFARKDRNTSDWYVGCITDENARELDILLNFLDADSKYTAQIYVDGDDAEWKTNPTSFKYEEKIVTASDMLHVKLATSGGCAIRFIKQ
ncbi:glycoside hydrolase family 97 C-terminal domain-containing protein [Bacteroides ovatus]|nr:glycoside hydrolase family 97 C-terminal domain-containing protein [Bacteroides ovatus]MCS2814477.1 glycoside hydrolase family 97 C-terminal domain-containing protein [Bacteroides ovatus]MCS3099209.1 glycoside hydrolase family 97 C-terminal domain-containing protein [Bacteroides ovatus]